MCAFTSLQTKPWRQLYLGFHAPSGSSPDPLNIPCPVGDISGYCALSALYAVADDVEQWYEYASVVSALKKFHPPGAPRPAASFLVVVNRYTVFLHALCGLQQGLADESAAVRFACLSDEWWSRAWKGILRVEGEG